MAQQLDQVLPPRLRGEVNYGDGLIPLDRWLGRSDAEFGALMANLRRHGSVRLFATAVRGAYGDGTARIFLVAGAMAVVGLIAIPLGCCCWPVGALAALVAVICGGMGLSKANALQGDGNERTLAIIGIVLGVVAFGVTIIGLLAGIANVATNSY